MRADSKLTSTETVTDQTSPLKPLRFHLNLNSDVPYLRQRGLTEDTIEHFGVGLCSRGMLKDYVAVPVYGFPQQADDKPVA